MLERVLFEFGQQKKKRSVEGDVLEDLELVVKQEWGKLYRAMI